jgi:hypothetical protein
LLPLNPFFALRYHFGMLLGVDDFETEQAYHRAKMWLHNAWLHREGVLWGFGVKLDQPAGEIRVLPGLALDSSGHELHLEADACVNVGAWFEKHKDDQGFAIAETGDTRKFDLHVGIRFKACLTRQVPALLEPCENADTSTAYSRVFETMEIFLLPNQAPPRVYPYHRLRVLFGLEDAATLPEAELNNLNNLEATSTIIPDDQAKLDASRSDQDVLDALTHIETLPLEQQPREMMRAFHRFAALDEIDLKPAISDDGARRLIFPGGENELVVLAKFTGVTLARKDGGWNLTGGTVDTSVRLSHVATTTIQDLLCGARLPGKKASEPDNGPRITRVILLNPRAIEFEVDKDLQDASVKPEAFSVTWFDRARGWQRSNVVTAGYSGTETRTVNLELDQSVSGRVRLIVFGTGATPLLGADLFPLAGAVGGSPGTLHDGHDFVHMRDVVDRGIDPYEEIATNSTTRTDEETGADEQARVDEQAKYEDQAQAEQPSEAEATRAAISDEDAAPKPRARTRRTRSTN